MSNEIAKIETINYDALDANVGSGLNDHEPLRFKDGKFLRGFEKIEVPVKTRFIACPASTSDGYMRWEDGRPTDTRIRCMNDPGVMPIFRQSLGDDDENQWPDGKDPWARIMLIALKDEDGIRLTFSTSSVGGENAIRSFLRDFKLIRHKHPGQVPVVEIGCGSYEHKVHRTTVKFPTFTIVDWAMWSDDDAVPAQTTPKALPPAEAKKRAVREELNDDLPDWAKAVVA
jgi:hypothetical protein